MTQIEKDPYEKYFEIINEEFNVVNKRLKQLIKDRYALGSDNESILRGFLKQYIPKHYSVGHGFVFKNPDEISNQCDIIIYDESFFPPMFKQDDFVIVQPESVMSIIEVKTTIKPGKSFLDSAIDNIRSIRKLNDRVNGLIFAYGGSKPVTICNALTEYYKRNERNLREIFELMVNLRGGYCIVLKKLDNEEVLFNINRDFKGDFVLSVIDTAKRTFYLFIYYVLRQLRTYIYNTFIATGKQSNFANDFSSVIPTPAGVNTYEDYFNNRKEELSKLHGDLKYNDKKEFLGI